MIGYEQPEVTDVRSIFRQDDMAGELARREPEGEIRRFTELELGMDPVGMGLLSLDPSPISPGT